MWASGGGASPDPKPHPTQLRLPGSVAGWLTDRCSPLGQPTVPHLLSGNRGQTSCPACANKQQKLMASGPAVRTPRSCSEGGCSQTPRHSGRFQGARFRPRRARRLTGTKTHL